MRINNYTRATNFIFKCWQKRNSVYHSIILIFLISQLGCKNFIDIDPPYTSVNAGNIYSNDETAAAVLTGLYAQLSSTNRNSFTSNNFLSNNTFFSGLLSDELTLYDINNSYFNRFYINDLREETAPNFLETLYPMIFTVNAAIISLSDNKILTPVVQKQILGEAKFFRAFAYFYLVNYYGDIPLVLSTDPDKNSVLARTSTIEVYNQIISDLKDAEILLSETFLDGSVKRTVDERVRPTKWAAAALLSRVYLYNGMFKLAEDESSTVINNSNLFGLESLNKVFLKNSKETIWQLQSVSSNQANTGEGQYFVLPDTGPDILGSYPVYLSKYIVNSFELGDGRKNNWVDSSTADNDVYYFSYKYKSGKLNIETEPMEYLMVLRLGEQYLIRAEARAMQDNLEGAKYDLNRIRIRAGLDTSIAQSKDKIVEAVLSERKVELFTEWGHRWLDLKRSGKVNEVMSKVTIEKGGTWSKDWQYYPFSRSLLTSDHYIRQNDGY